MSASSKPNAAIAAPRGDAAGQTRVPPRLVGAGLGGAELTGQLWVTIADEAQQPLAGARVRVGALSARTDGTGLAHFEDASLRGPQTVSVEADGYAASSVIGLHAEQVSLALTPYPRHTPSANVSGTIDLPAPAQLGHYTAALVLYSNTATYGAPENTLEQPKKGDAPANLCIRLTVLDPATCSWQMQTRVGRQVHYAILVDGDPGSTLTDTSDDRYRLIGYALRDEIELEDGQTVQGETLAPLPSAALTELTVRFPSAVASLPSQIAVPLIDLGERGRLLFPLPMARPDTSTVQLPALHGPFEGGRYLLVALASPALNTSHPFSSSFIRDLSPAEIALPQWQAAPGTPSGHDGAYRFAPTKGASFHLANFVDADDTPLWTLLLLDTSGEFELPELDSDPLPTTPLALKVSASEVPGFDPRNFSFATFNDSVLRVSESVGSVQP